MFSRLEEIPATAPTQFVFITSPASECQGQNLGQGRSESEGEREREREDGAQTIPIDRLTHISGYLTEDDTEAEAIVVTLRLGAISAEAANTVTTTARAVLLEGTERSATPRLSAAIVDDVDIEMEEIRGAEADAGADTDAEAEAGTQTEGETETGTTTETDTDKPATKITYRSPPETAPASVAEFIRTVLCSLESSQ